MTATSKKQPQDHRAKASSKPSAPDVDLDLDTIEREPDTIAEPFTVRVGGKTYTLSDPMEIDYQEYSQLTMTPAGERRMLELVLGDEVDDFMANKLPSWKVWKVFEDWQQHYGMPSPGKPDA